MSEKAKRPWLRFHLLTLVLMSFVAGGILWANVAGGIIKFEPCWGYQYYGWPVGFRGEWMRAEPMVAVDKSIRAVHYVAIAFFDTDAALPDDAVRIDERASWKAIAADTGIGLSILAWIAFVSESLLRRREGRRT